MESFSRAVAKWEKPGCGPSSPLPAPLPAGILPCQILQEGAQVKATSELTGFIDNRMEMLF